MELTDHGKDTHAEVRHETPAAIAPRCCRGSTAQRRRRSALDETSCTPFPVRTPRSHTRRAPTAVAYRPARPCRRISTATASANRSSAPRRAVHWPGTFLRASLLASGPSQLSLVDRRLPTARSSGRPGASDCAKSRRVPGAGGRVPALPRGAPGSISPGRMPCSIPQTTTHRDR
jgi:hypothetical protein